MCSTRTPKQGGLEPVGRLGLFGGDPQRLVLRFQRGLRALLLSETAPNDEQGHTDDQDRHQAADRGGRDRVARGDTGGLCTTIRPLG